MKHLFKTSIFPIVALFVLLGTMVSCIKTNHTITLPTPITPDTIVPPLDTTAIGFAKGADVSWITEMEDNKVKFYDTSGTQQEGMNLLKSLGMNAIRLRVWVNPAGVYNTTADVLTKALRAKALGMRIMIDFHFSDIWADPGNQATPAAWALLDLAGLKTAVANHTTAVLSTLKENSIIPEWVQMGNETNDGMLYPLGKASTNMANFAQLINSGYDAAKAVFPKVKVIVHVSNGYNNDLFVWLFGGLVSKGAKFDVIGMSLYPTVSNWSAYNVQCYNNMNDMVARYNKEVMVVEVGMPWDTPLDCKAFITDLISKTKSVTKEKGRGVFYWEPESYKGWQGYSLGAFDNSGKPTIALDAFK